MNPEKLIPIDATVGSEVTRVSTHTFYLFWLPKPGDGQVKDEIGLDTAVKYRPNMRKEYAKSFPAMLDRDCSVGGSWTDARYTVEDGTVLKVWGERSQWGAVQGKAALVLLCSKQAPVNRIILKLSGQPMCSRAEVHITGQFWVLDRDTVEEHTDMPTLTKQCAHYSSPVFVKEVFTIQECVPAPEKAMAQKVNTKTINTGETVKASGTIAQGTITLKTRKGKRVMG